MPHRPLLPLPLGSPREILRRLLSHLSRPSHLRRRQGRRRWASLRHLRRRWGPGHFRPPRTTLRPRRRWHPSRGPCHAPTAVHSTNPLTSSVCSAGRAFPLPSPGFRSSLGWTPRTAHASLPGSHRDGCPGIARRIELERARKGRSDPTFQPSGAGFGIADEHTLNRLLYANLQYEGLLSHSATGCFGTFPL